MTKILVIEDDVETPDGLAAGLALCGFQTERRPSADAEPAVARPTPFDAIALHLTRPISESFRLIDRLRAKGAKAPVLVIGADDHDDPRIAALRECGDDYLTEPFTLSEFLVRLDAVLHRPRAYSVEPRIVLGDLELDVIARVAWRAGRPIELSPAEFSLLRFMTRNAGQTLSRRMLFEAVWGHYFDPGAHVIEAHTVKLREKFELPGLPSPFEIEPGKGYTLRAVGEASNGDQYWQRIPPGIGVRAEPNLQPAN